MKHILFFTLFLFATSSKAQILFEETFEQGSLGSQWTAQPNITGTEGIVEVTKGSSFASKGQFGVVLGRNSAGGFTTNALDLTLDLSDRQEVKLSFDIKDNQEETHHQDGLYFSDNGGSSFVKVYDFRPEEWCNEYGGFPPFDVDALAAAHGLSLSEQFVIRFQQYDDGGPGIWSDYDGIFIDNVVIEERPVVYASLPFSEGFEDPGLGASWKWAQPEATSLANTVKPGGYAGVSSTAKLSGAQGLFLALNCAEGFTTNAADLHLDLSGESGVKLSFDIKDKNEETHPQDGLYFSDNGGRSFVKVYDFRPEEWCNEYGAFPPFDVDALAAAHGLSLSDQFVIRFQQYDDGGPGIWSDYDGIFIDNVKVRASTAEYASLPFTDGFEDQELNKSWAWVHAVNTGLPNTTRPSGSVAISAGAKNTGAQGLQMGKTCDADGFTTSAVDLHLNLMNQDQIELSFDVKNLKNEAHEQDAIYFSEDGGENFSKIYSMDFSELPENEFSTIVINLTQEEANINFTQNSVIRFQHYDDGSFSSWKDTDGLYIDNVSVKSLGAPIVAAPQNFLAEPKGNTILLSWEYPEGAADNFILSRSSSEDGAYTIIQSTAGESRNYTDRDIEPNTLYFYKIIASKEEDQSTSLTKSVTSNPLVEGTHDELSAGTRIYPNPTNALVNIEIEHHLTGAFEFRLLDLSGQLQKIFVAEKSLPILRNQLDIKAFSPGIYILEIRHHGYRAVVRLVKE